MINQHAKVAEWLKTPRAVLLRFPFGRPLGEPGNAPQHRVIAEDALEVLVTAQQQCTIVSLPYQWRRTDFAAVLMGRRALAGQMPVR